MTAVIVSGGAVPERLFEALSEALLVVACDSGAAAAVRLGLTPDIVLGDFDSISIDEAGRLAPDAEFIAHPARKDKTDTELALDVCLERGADDIIITAATGSRLDHSLANVALLGRSGARIRLMDGTNIAEVVRGRARIERRDGAFLSLLPFGGGVSGVSVSGVKYPLSGASLPVGASLGVSNEFTGRFADINVESGALLVIISRD
ncbi:MAG: thiamine diphosphokinase [Clostridiales bacterium]|jgi:thiamine pyrophosphokinase|nr:thiamine diphosphokinase [Clostridiales bacterium]